MKVRVRLTLLLTLSLVVAGAAALVVNGLSYENSIYKSSSSFSDALLRKLGIDRAQAEAYVRAHPEVVFDERATDAPRVNQAFQAVQRDAQADAIRRSRIWSVLVMGALGIAAAAGGWLIAGRILRPVRLITRRAKSSSATSLDARVALDGPEDELKELADTFDEMMERLQQSFLAQRRFASQVSHELRTPLSIIRSETELLLAEESKPGVRERLANVNDAVDRADRVISGLLVLTRIERGDLDRQKWQLDEIVGDTVARTVEAVEWRDLRVDLELNPATIVGDRSLLEAVVRNVVDNAGQHNRPNGSVRVRVYVAPRDSHDVAILEVVNTKPVESGTRPAGDGRGAGGSQSRHRVGLTVVQAVLEAHDGVLEWLPNVEEVEVRVCLPVVTQPGVQAAMTVTTDEANAPSEP
jgi:signal transduction histidine kinase